MDYHDEDFLPSEEELDEIWDFLIKQSELDIPFGRIAKAKLESLPPEPTTIFWVCLLQAVNRKAPVPRGVIDYYRHYMDQDKLDRMDLEDVVVADE